MANKLIGAVICALATALACWAMPAKAEVKAGGIKDFIASYNETIKKGDKAVLSEYFYGQGVHLNSYGTRSDVGRLLKGQKDMDWLCGSLLDLYKEKYPVAIDSAAEIRAIADKQITYYPGTSLKADEAYFISSSDKDKLQSINYEVRMLAGKWAIYSIYESW